MQLIKNLLTIAAIGTIVVSTTAWPEGEMVEDYATDSSGAAGKNAYGECWRTSYRDTTDKREECGYEKPKPAPVVKSREAVVKATTVDEKIAISAGVLFTLDSAELSDEGKSIIDERIAKYRGKVKRSMDIEVIGHTDSSGSQAYNQKLSERRAKNVADYLEQQTDIPHTAIKFMGKGESEPFASNDTAEGRAANRRVEVRLQGIIVITQ